MNEQVIESLQIIKIIITTLFLIETFMKLIGLGFRMFFVDKFNIVDAIVAIIGLVKQFEFIHFFRLIFLFYLLSQEAQ
jgi:hypothetical protein